MFLGSSYKHQHPALLSGFGAVSGTEIAWFGSLILKMAANSESGNAFPQAPSFSKISPNPVIVDGSGYVCAHDRETAHDPFSEIRSFCIPLVTQRIYTI